MFGRIISWLTSDEKLATREDLLRFVSGRAALVVQKPIYQHVRVVTHSNYDRVIANPEAAADLSKLKWRLYPDGVACVIEVMLLGLGRPAISDALAGAKHGRDDFARELGGLHREIMEAFASETSLEISEWQALAQQHALRTSELAFGAKRSLAAIAGPMAAEIADGAIFMAKTDDQREADLEMTINYIVFALAATTDEQQRHDLTAEIFVKMLFAK